MVRQVLALLKPAPLKTYGDLTVGEGGHAEAILAASSPDGRLVGFDRDAGVLEIARARLTASYAGRFELVHAPFSEARRRLASLGLSGFDGVLADFGLSSWQLDDAGRGFSFRSEGALDMRMDMSQALTAWEIVNRWTRDRIGDVLRMYGEERRADRIARAIRDRPGSRPIETTGELAEVVRVAAGRARSGRIDAATRAFQALRIAVNDELEEIRSLMEGAVDMLNPGGVIVCLSYHSLEDGLVKRAMAAARREGRLSVLTPKPLRPSRDEVTANRRARSAKLRAAQRPAATEGPEGMEECADGE